MRKRNNEEKSWLDQQCMQGSGRVQVLTSCDNDHQSPNLVVLCSQRATVSWLFVATECR
eukprot:m.160903 g.160903  ORF g.160903 m.160903 type:complete len:59 (-) comp14353_c0_seq3:435-611(-)